MLAAHRSQREGVNNVRLLLFILGPGPRAAFRLESLLWFSLNFPLLDAGGGSHSCFTFCPVSMVLWCFDHVRAVLPLC